MAHRKTDKLFFRKIFNCHSTVPFFSEYKLATNRYLSGRFTMTVCPQLEKKSVKSGRIE
jgi:hypothetical protein